ncbi:MAG: amino acid transporter substrate-binding protein, partial [Frankiales bacterium]|nr:amino acid transporter substrate-binding protein [Frankiales bacterium]
MALPLRTTSVLALVATGALTLSACGDSGDDTKAAGPSASPACQKLTTAALPPAGTKITPPAGVSKSDGVLTIGSVLPQTGNLAFLGPPEFAGVGLALSDINAAGGVLGKPVAYVKGDSGDAQQDVANPTVDRELAAGADVLIGAASSGVTKTFLDKATSAGVVVYSPANTSPDFTTIADKGLYFRTAPSDVLQGRVLGEKIVAEGKQNVAIIALQDPYGTGLAANAGRAICAGGSNVPVDPIFYDPAASNFDAQVGQVVAAKPDAVVLIGFDESAKIIQALAAQKVGPQDISLYLVDGNVGNALGAKLPAGLLKDVKGSQPGAQAVGDFKSRLLKIDPALSDFNYSGESYDAVVTSALAATVAKSDAGDKIAAALPDVTRGGTKCTTFADCKKLADAGTDLDYDGASGPIEFSDVGDPTQATIGIYSYG